MRIIMYYNAVEFSIRTQRDNVRSSFGKTTTLYGRAIIVLTIVVFVCCILLLLLLLCSPRALTSYVQTARIHNIVPIQHPCVHAYTIVFKNQSLENAEIGR